MLIFIFCLIYTQNIRIIRIKQRRLLLWLRKMRIKIRYQRV
nr:MAG TPA: hypothetical protein [Caudoviricetes sp.]